MPIWSMFRKAVGVIVFTLVSVALMLEGALRLFPQLVPADMIRAFNERFQTAIAAAHGLPNDTFSTQLSGDDGGPYYVWNPHTVLTYPNLYGPGKGAVIQVDKEGYCNPPGAADRPTAAVVAIGDSFTFCDTSDPHDPWPNRLSEETGLTAYNLGIPSSSPYEELQRLKRNGLNRKPAVVVMAIYEGNDLREAEAYEKTVAASTTPAVKTEKVEPPCALPKLLCPAKRAYLGTRDALYHHSYVYDLVTGFWKQPAVRREIARARLQHAGEDGFYPDLRYDIAMPDGSSYTFNPDSHDGDEPTAAYRLRKGEVRLDVFDRALSEFKALGREHGFTPVVAYVPTAPIIYTDYVTFKDSRVKDLYAEFSGKQRAYFEAKTREFGLAYVDTTPVLQAAAADHRSAQSFLYFVYNMHPTPEGHRVIARALAPAVRAAVNRR